MRVSGCKLIFVSMCLEVICCPSSTPSLWLPNNCTWIFHPFWRFRGCFCCCFPPPKELLFSDLKNLQKARLWLASHTDCKGSCGERLWGETKLGKSRAHKVLNVAFNKYCSTVLYIPEESCWQVTQPDSGCSKLCSLCIRHEQGAYQTFWVSCNGTVAPSSWYQSLSIRLTYLRIASHNFLRGAHKTEITREAPTELFPKHCSVWSSV